MDSNRVCHDTSAPETVVRYEISRETYRRLRELAQFMDRREATRPYAAVMQSLFGEVVCALED